MTQASRDDSLQSESAEGVGASQERIDISEKIRGQAEYESDLRDDDLLHGAVLRSETPHGQVTAVDTDPAEAMDAVVAAVSRQDLFGPFDDTVRHYGDVIAAVAATDRASAVAALDRIEFEVTPLESVFDPLESVRGTGPRLHPNNPDLHQHRRHDFTVRNDEYTTNIDDYHRYSHGDVDAGFDDADVVYEATYRTPRTHHCNLQTHCCLARWDDGVLRLVQTLGNLEEGKEEIAAYCGIDPDEVVIEAPPTNGSSFGGRSLSKPTLEPVAATLAARADRPVKLWFDRGEEFVGAETRHGTVYTVRMGITAEGTMTALDIDLVADTGAYPNGVGHIVLSNSRDRPLDLYEVPNYRFEGVSVYTNNVTAGEYRGIGVTQLTTVLDSHVDETARKAGLDPIELRQRNFVREGDTPPNRDAPIQSCGIEECLRRGTERFQSLRQGPTDDPDRIRGWGVGVGTHTTGVGGSSGDTSEARVTLRPDGTVTVEMAAVDLGQGAETVMAQIVTEETGIGADDVDVDRFPTDSDLEDPLGSVASRSTYIVGAAVRDAAQRLASDVRERVAASRGCCPAAVQLRNGTAFVDGRESAFDAVLDDPLSAVGHAETADAPPAYGAHFAEVEVDTGTGAVSVLTYVAAQDVGFAINPEMVVGQLEGAVCHGLELALFSELRLDDGVPENATLADYSVVSPMEMPDALECVVVESAEESGPYGAKGLGTPSQPPVPPAVTNALRDCTGVRFTDLPADAETVYTALTAEATDA